MRSVTTGLLLLLLMFPAVKSQAGQEHPESPILRVSSYSVVVDVVVTDQKSRHVTDLSGDDFLIYENGLPQSVESFQFIGPEESDAATPENAVSASATSASGTEHESTPVPAEGPVLQESARAPNLVIVLLDYASVEFLNQHYIQKAAARYVRERMKPNDLMAVFQVGMSLRFLQGFTDDKEKLLAAVSRTSLAGSSYAGDQAQLVTFADEAQDQVEFLNAAIDSISAGRSFVPGGAAQIIEQLNQQMEVAQRMEGTYYAQLSYSREQQSRPIIGAIETIARGVQHIPGRKTLVLFSEGFSVPMSLERALYRAVDQANKSNLAVYAIDGAGLQVKSASLEGELYDISALRSGDRVKAFGGLSQFDRAREIGSDQKDSTLRFITSATGGFLVRHTNDFLGALQRIDDDVRSHYVLTYRPSDADFNGEFREIRVEVRRPGVRVRARSGYWAIPPGAALLSADEYRSLVRLPAREKSAPAPLPVSTQLGHFIDSPQDYRVSLVVELPLAEFNPFVEEGRRFIDLSVFGLVLDESGQVVSSFRGPSRLILDGTEYARARHVRLESNVRLTPGHYSVLIKVEDPNSKRENLRQLSLKLPPIEADLATSSLVLGKSDEIVPASPGDPLAMNDYRVTPSARRQFSNGEELIYLLEVYHPGTNEDRRPELEVEWALFRNGRFVSRDSEPLETALLVDPLPRCRLARFLELEGLAPGRYSLRITVRDRVLNAERTTQTAFDLVQ